MGRVGEESPEVVRTQFGPGGGEKLCPEPLGCSDPDLTFSAASSSISTICMISVFYSHSSDKFSTG